MINGFQLHDSLRSLLYHWLAKLNSSTAANTRLLLSHKNSVLCWEHTTTSDDTRLWADLVQHDSPLTKAIGRNAHHFATARADNISGNCIL